MKVNSSFVQNFITENQDLFQDKRSYRRLRGSKFLASDMLNWILQYYLENDAEEHFYEFAYYSRFAANFRQTTVCERVNGDIDAVRVGYEIWHRLAKYCNSNILSESVLSKNIQFNEVLLEKFDSIQDAISSCNVENLLRIVSIMPDEAFEDMIAELALRASSTATDSLYNDYIDDVRISNHWDNVTTNRTLEGNLQNSNLWRLGRFSHEEVINGRNSKIFIIEKTYKNQSVDNANLVKRYNKLMQLFKNNKQRLQVITRERNRIYSKLQHNRV